MKIIPTSVRNLVLEANYQIYYVRLRIGGRLYFRSLAERDLAQAQLKLPAKLAEIRDAAAKHYVAFRLISRMTFREAVETYTGDFENDPRLAPRTKVVRRNAIAAVRRTWPAVFERELREISHEDLKRYLRDFENGKGRWTPPGAKKTVPGTSPTTINGMIKLFNRGFQNRCGCRSSLWPRLPARQRSLMRSRPITFTSCHSASSRRSSFGRGSDSCQLGNPSIPASPTFILAAMPTA